MLISVQMYVGLIILVLQKDRKETVTAAFTFGEIIHIQQLN